MSATTDASLRETLKDVESQLGEKRGERAELLKARDEAKEQYASADDKSQKGEAFKNAEAAVAELGKCDDYIDSLKQTQTMTLRLLGKDAPNSGDAQRQPAGDPNDPRSGDVWDSSQLLAGPEAQALLEHHAHSKSHMGTVELGQVISRDALAADVAPTSNQRRGQYLGVVPQLRRMLRVLDLIPTGTMDNNVLPYTQESGSFTSAKGVKEGEAKPEAGVTFTDAEAVARTIAHWMKIRKQALSDVSALRSIIDSRLRYGIERVLEAEILSGTGTDPALTGILKTTGLGVVKYNASTGPTLNTDNVLRGITTVLLADAFADGIVMHPTDWQDTLMAKANGEGMDGHYYGGGPFQITPQQLWGVPLVPSPAIPVKEILVGDFAIGAQLFIREGVNVLMSDSDGEDFIKNRVTMLAEMRAALAVFRPAAFCRVWLDKTVEEAG